MGAIWLVRKHPGKASHRCNHNICTFQIQRREHAGRASSKWNDLTTLAQENCLYRFVRDEGIDLDELRTRLRKMSDDELVRFGKAARFMCRDKPPRQVFVTQSGSASFQRVRKSL
jgi:hypothetical protein